MILTRVQHESQQVAELDKKKKGGIKHGIPSKSRRRRRGRPVQQ